MVRYPPCVLNFTQTRVCDTPFCNVSCAIVRYSIKKKKKQAQKSFAIRSLQVSRDTTSIAAGPLRCDESGKLIPSKISQKSTFREALGKGCKLHRGRGVVLLNEFSELSRDFLSFLSYLESPELAEHV